MDMVVKILIMCFAFVIGTMSAFMEKGEYNIIEMQKYEKNASFYTAVYIIDGRRTDS